MNTVYWVLVAFGIVVLEARLRARNVRYLPILPAIVLGAVLSKVTYVVLQWHYAFPRWSWGAFTVFQPDTFCFFGGAVGVVLGVKGEAKGYVTLVLSDKLRTLLKMIPLPRKMSKTPDQVEEFNVYAYVKQLIDGNDVSVLLGVADEVVKVMDTLKFYIPTLKDMSMGLKLSLELIRRYLPEGAFSRIYLDEQPVDSGSYVAGAVALESGDLNTAGVAMFRIKPKTEGVRTYWTQEVPDTMTVEEAQNYDLSAVLEVDGQPVPEGKISYTYKKGGWFGSKSDTLPTQPGEYVQTATVGGNVSTNAGGRRAVKYGVTRDYVRGLEVVLADGTVMQVGGKQVKDASGLSLKHLLIGSEGTLAVITKCLLRLVPKPEASLSVLVPYADLKTGIQSVLTILRANANPTAVEFMERKVVALGERFCGVSYPRPDAGSYILLTFDGRSEEVTANAARVRSLALQNGALDFIELSDARQCADIWRVRGALVKAVEAVSEQEPVDIVVPISRTADFIRFINDLEARSGMQMVSFGHAGDGNVHLCVVRGERDEETWQRELHENMDRAYAEAYRLGGVASGEHGIGLSKRPYFLRQTAKENLQAMNAIKTALDPQHILNNGKSYLTGGNNNAGTF